MTNILILFPGAEDATLFVEDGVVSARGSGAAACDEEDVTTVLIAPAAEVGLHHAALGGLKPAQARAAARLLLAEQCLLPPGDAHFAIGETDGEAGTIVARASATAMAQWVADFDPDIILPAQLVLPQAGDGFSRGLVGGEALLRGQSFGFPDDDIVAPLLIGTLPVHNLDAGAVESALVAAALAPPLNVRQGDFAKKQSWQIDRSAVRLALIAAAALILISIAIPLAEMARLGWRTAAIEDAAQARAQAALGDASPPEDPVTALDQRLATYRGGGAGFAATMAATAQAVRATPNAELIAASFRSDGVLVVNARLAIADEARLLQDRLRANGLLVTAKPMNPSQNPPVIELEVRGQ